MANAFDQFDKPAGGNAFDQFDAPAPVAAAEPPKKSSLLRRTLGDTAVDLGKGIVGAGEAAVGLADIPTGGHAGKALESIGFRPAEAKAAIGEFHSDERKAANAKVEQAEGFVDTAAAMLQNPSTIAGAVGESIPLMLGGGGIARGLTGVKALAASPVARAALGEGVAGAGSAAESLRQESDGGLLSGRQTVAALGTGVGTAVIGAAGGGVARKLGIGDVDTALAGGIEATAPRPSLLRRTAAGAVSEGVLEEMPQSAQEQVWQNFGNERDLGEGVAEASAMGLLAGAAMGGPFAAISGGGEQAPTLQRAPPIVEPTPAPVVPHPGAAPGSLSDVVNTIAAATAPPADLFDGAAITAAAAAVDKGLPAAGGEAATWGRPEAKAFLSEMLAGSPDASLPKAEAIAVSFDLTVRQADELRHEIMTEARANAASGGSVTAGNELAPDAAVGAGGVAIEDAAGVRAPAGSLAEAVEVTAAHAKTPAATAPETGGLRIQDAIDGLTDDAPAAAGATATTSGEPAPGQAPRTSAATTAQADLATAAGAVASARADSAAEAGKNSVNAAVDAAATNPLNDVPLPTEAQKEAGNYQKGHARVAGLDIAIENPAGTQRDPKWKPLAHHYGYIKGSVGADKDHVDVFLTADAADESRPVFVVDQTNKDGTFDEHKVVMGAIDEASARAAYLDNYDDNWTGLGGITQMTQAEFKAWVKDPAQTVKPLALQGELVDSPQQAEIVPAPKGERISRGMLDGLGLRGSVPVNGKPWIKTGADTWSDGTQSGTITTDALMALANDQGGVIEGQSSRVEKRVEPSRVRVEPTTANPSSASIERVEPTPAPATFNVAIEDVRPQGKKAERGFGLERSVTEAITARGLNPDDYTITKTPLNGFIGVRKTAAAADDAETPDLSNSSSPPARITRPAAKSERDEGFTTAEAALKAATKAGQDPADYEAQRVPSGFVAVRKAAKAGENPSSAAAASTDFTAQEQWAGVVEDLTDAQVTALAKAAKLGNKGDSIAEKRALLSEGNEFDLSTLYESMVDDGSFPADPETDDTAEEDWDYDVAMFPPPARSVDANKEAGPLISVAEAKSRLAEWKAEAKRIGETEDHSNDVIISLFDATGEISKPWREAGYDVRQYDIKLGDDLLERLPMADLIEMADEGKRVVGVLAQPPCTCFSSSGARWWKTRHDVDDRAMVAKMFGPAAPRYFSKPKEYTRALVSMVDLVVGETKPLFHLMENPTGRIADEMGLPKPTLSFDPNVYGNPYTKRTRLWGNFNTDLPTAHIEPTQGSLMHKLWSTAEKNGGTRSITPEGFAYAFFMANKDVANQSPVAATATAPAPGSRVYNDDGSYYNVPKAEKRAKPAASANEGRDWWDALADQQKKAALIQAGMQPNPNLAWDSMGSIQQSSLLATRAPAGSTNTVFTQDAYEAARALLKSKLGTVNSGLDPEIVRAGIAVAGYHIEKGARSFAAYSKAMLEDMGEAIRPYLKSWYIAIKFDPSARDFDGMDSASDVESATDEAPETAAEPEAQPEVAAAKPRKGKPAIGPKTLTQKWPGSIDGYGGDYRGDRDTAPPGSIKHDFLAESRKYMTAVAEVLKAHGYAPHLDRKGKPDKAVSVNESGIASSGEVSLDMVNADVGVAVYLQIAESFNGGGKPQIMARTGSKIDKRFGGDGHNQWLAIDMDSDALAAKLMDMARQQAGRPKREPADIGAAVNAAVIEHAAAQGNAAAIERLQQLVDGLPPSEGRRRVEKAIQKIGTDDVPVAAAELESAASILNRHYPAQADVLYEIADQLSDPAAAARSSDERAVPATDSAQTQAQEATNVRRQDNRDSDRTGGVRGNQREQPAEDRNDDPAANLDAQQPEEAGGSGQGRATGDSAQAALPDRAGSGVRNPDGQPAPDRDGVPAERGPAAGPVAAKSDLTITGELDFTGVGAVGKFKQNLTAIALLKTLESEDRRATPAEQSILAKYVGWGGIPQAFRHPTKGVTKGWEARVAELEEAMTPEELAAAGRSTQDAHYTAANVVTAMWDAVARLGFTRGRVLEPSMGTGNFFGLMPAGVRSASSLTGVELDSITGRIAKQLYQTANVQVRGFNDIRIAPASFDLAIGNPPFGAQAIHDPQYPELAGSSIHNFFFAKSIASLRPGGVLAMVVSSSFLDANTSSTRSWIAERASFVGAIRLPQTAFQANAGTNVTTDIVFLQRLPDGAKSNPETWVRVGSASDKGTAFALNKYFVDHPDMMLGRMVMSAHNTRGNGSLAPVLEANPGEDLAEALNAAVAKLPQGIHQAAGKTFKEATAKADAVNTSAAVPVGARVYGYFQHADGTLHQRQPDYDGEVQSTPVEISPTVAARVIAMAKIRDLTRDLLASEHRLLSTDGQIEAKRAALNTAYDAFVKEFGRLSRDVNKRAYRDDSDIALLMSLERDYDKGVSSTVAKKLGVPSRKESAKKADLFTKRLNFPTKPVTSVTDAKSAMLASLNEYGRLDADYMAGIYAGKSIEDIETELGDQVFRDEAGDLVPSDLYLSGNVKAKLAAVKLAAKTDRRLERNVAALEAVQPPDVDPADIFVQLGTPWIPASDFADFARETFEGKLTGAYVRALGGWRVEVTAGNQLLARERWGHKRLGADEILTLLMANKPVAIYDKGPGRDDPRVLNVADTAAAKGKAEEMQQHFLDWIWKDSARRERLGRFYNDTYNTDVRWKPSGEHMTFPGKTDAITLRPHQSAFAYRVVQQGVALADHVVGAGKTFADIAAVMEMRRLGLWRKPMLVVPNHLVDQWAADFARLYPGANVLAATRKDFEKGNRKRLFARIATGDWDAVIVAHSSFGFIPLPPEAEAAILREEAAEITQALDAMREGKKDLTYKQLQKRKEALDEKLKALADRPRDDLMDFAEMGVDALNVDEAHEFKNLFFTTTQRGVAGLGSPEGSKKAFDLFVKTRYLEGINGGKNRVFLTGTPVSNSLAEVFHMQRYLQMGELKDRGIAMFDTWAQTFGQIVSDWEMDAAGRFKEKSRFRKFANLPELVTMWRKVADTVTMADLKSDAIAQGKRFPVPKIKGGKRNNITVDRSPQQAAYIGVPVPVFNADGTPSVDPETGIQNERYPEGSIIYRMDNMPKDPSEDNHLKATGDARKASLDYRLVDPGAPDFAGSKINRAVADVASIWEDNAYRRGTQLVFCDLSVPASARGKATEAAQARIPTWFTTRGGELEHVAGVKLSLSAMAGRQFFSFKTKKDGYQIYEAGSGTHITGGKTKQEAIDQANAALTKRAAEFQSTFTDNAIPGEVIDSYIQKWEDAKAAKEAEAAETGDDDKAPEQETISMDDLLADSSKHSVYDDFKAKLIAKGVPAAEIAFIHDYNTDAQKADLFAKVNRGDIRVLMGSTAKMGAGMNVQKKLVALHHLDAPWRPSDMTQREGRAIRQGNEFYEADPDGFEIILNAYGTSETYDSRQYEIIETKALGIETFQAGSGSVREIDDVASESANSADMKAAASGNPLIPESIKLKKAVRDLEAQEKSHTRAMHSMETLVRSVDNKSAWPYKHLADMKAQAARYANQPFELTLNGTTYTDPKDVKAGPIMSVFKDALSARDPVGAGSFRGLDVFAHQAGFSGSAIRVSLFDGREQLGSTEFGKEDKVSPAGFVTRLENIFKRIESAVPAAESSVAKVEREADQAREEMKRGFPKSAELTEKRERQAKVVAALRAGKREIEGDAGVDALGEGDNGSAWMDEANAEVSRAEGESDATKLGLRAAVDALLGETGHRVEYLRGYAGLPERLRTGVMERNALNRAGQTAALYDADTGRTFIFTNVITDPQKAAWNAAHEIAGHHGLRTLFGDKLDAALELADANPTVKDLADVMTVQRKLRPDQRLLAIEEALAELAAASRTGNFDRINERYQVQVPDGMRGRIRVLLENFLRKLAALFRTAGVVFKDHEVSELLEAAWQAAQGPASRGPAGGQALEANEVDLDEVLEEHGQAVDSDIDAIKRWNDGERLFGMHEMGDTVTEISSLEMLRKFAPDQLIALKRSLATSLGLDNVEQATPSPDVTIAAVDAAAVGMPDSLAAKAREAFAGLKPANLRENTRPTWLGALTLRHLAELGGDIKLKQVARYSARVQRMASDRNVMQEESAAVAKPWEAFQSKDRAGADATANLMHDTTIAGVDPSVAYAPLRTGTTQRGPDEAVTAASIRTRLAMVAADKSDTASGSTIERLDAEAAELRMLLARERKRQEAFPALVQQWLALPEAGREVYIAARDAYAKQSDRLEQAILARIAATEADDRTRAAFAATLRHQFETARLEGPYFPLSRFGEFWIKAAKNGESAFMLYETVQEWRDAQRDLAAAGFVVEEAGKKIAEARSVAGASTGFMSDLQGMLEKAGVDDATRDDVWQLFLRTLPEVSMRKHAIHRKKTKGYSKDALRAFAGNMFHGSFQIARVLHVHELEADLLDLKKATADIAKTDPERAIKAAALTTEVALRHEWVMNPKDSKAVSMLTGLGFAWYLGATPAAALVNLTQTAIVTFPVLASRFGAVKAGNALTNGMGKAFRNLDGKQRGLSEEETAAFKVWRASGTLDRTEAHNLAGLAETDTQSFNPIARRAMTVVSWLFHHAEMVNRETTALAAFRLAREAGDDFAAATQYAEDVITESHFDYSNANRARFMQGNAAKVLLLFRQYSLNITWFLWRNAYLSLKGESPEVQKAARIKLGGVLGMTGMFAGVLGMPLMSVTFGLANAAAAAFGGGDDDDEPFDAEVEFRNFLADMLGAGVANVITNGPIDAITGAGISGRVGLNDLWLRDPDRELEGKAMADYLLEQAAGPVAGGMLVNTLRGMQLVGEGHTWRGVETMMPKVVKDGMKSIRYSTQGVNNMRGDPIIDDLSVGGTLLQLAGFSPASLNVRYDANSAAKNFEQHLLRRRSSLLDAYAMAWRNGDAETLAATRDKIMAWNGRNPELGITMATIRRSLESRMRYSLRAESGVVLNAKVADRAREQARFAAADEE